MEIQNQEKIKKLENELKQLQDKYQEANQLYLDAKEEKKVYKERFLKLKKGDKNDKNLDDKIVQFYETENKRLIAQVRQV